MQTVIGNPRNGCGLHGALQTVQEISGCVPIVHANAGCAVQNYLANKASGLGSSSISGYTVPATDSQERHIIFGGASRLREQIKNTIKVVEGDLYIVLNSCESAMVGDDVDAMTREAQEQGEAVIDSLIAGFHGDSHYGYENVLADIIKKLPEVKKSEAGKEADMVNVFGILPQKDVYFKGDIEEIKRILEGIGLRVNTFFGPANGVREFVKAPNASLNLVFSGWGLKAAEKLEELYGIPNLAFASTPIGIREVKSFVETVAETLSLDKEKVQSFIDREEENFNYYYRRIIDSYYEDHVGKTVGIVGDESTVIRTASYLKDYLGVIVEAAVITDFFPSDELPYSEKAKQLKGLAASVFFSQDSEEINGILQNQDIELILASSLEDDIAEKKGIVNLQISYPIYDRSVVNKTYAGIRGALTLTEDFITKVKEANRAREKYLQELIQGR